MAAASCIDLSPGVRAPARSTGVAIVFKFAGNCRHLFHTGRPFRRQWIDKFRGLESGNVPRQTLRETRSRGGKVKFGRTQSVVVSPLRTNQKRERDERNEREREREREREK